MPQLASWVGALAHECAALPFWQQCMDKGKQRYVAPGAAARDAATGAASHAQLMAALGKATVVGAPGTAVRVAGINAASHAQPPKVGVVVIFSFVHS